MDIPQQQNAKIIEFVGHDDKKLKAHENILNRYTLQVSKRPYSLTDQDKQTMRALFAEVMEPLSFHAKPAFIERLFDTDYLLRVFDSTGELAAFGNMVKRRIAGREVTHIIAVYVSPRHRGKALMHRVLGSVLIKASLKHLLRTGRSLVMTASAANPLVLYAASKYCRVWPDLRTGRAVPAWVEKIVDESSQLYYPKQTGKRFQVQITDEFAGFKEGEVQLTRDKEFNRKFYEYADPAQYKLIFFVFQVRLRDILKNFLPRWLRRY